MRWFGESWGAPVCDPEYHVETPVGEECGYQCHRPIEAGDQGLSIVHLDAKGEDLDLVPWHLGCFERSVLPPPDDT